MLDCFAGLVTLENTCDTGTAGVLSLQTLGITESLIGKILNDEETPETFLANCEQIARTVLAHDLSTAFSKRMIPRTFIDTEQFGTVDDDQELQSATASTRGGVVVEINQPKSNTILRISTLGLWFPTTGTTTITIYDLATGQPITTQDLDHTANEVSMTQLQIVIPASRRKRQLFITHDAVSYFKTPLAGDGCGSCGNAGWLRGGVHVWGARISTAVAVKRTNLQYSGNTSGLFATITLECNHAEFFCEVRNSLALPYLYKVGEIITGRAYDAFSRLNSEVSHKKELAERRDRLGAEYAAAMKNTVGSMQLPRDPLCFICHQNVTSSISAP